MFHAVVRMLIPSKKRREALEILNSFAQRVRVEPGCISSRVYQGTEEGTIMLEELWKTKGDLERHFRSEDYRNVLLVIEMANEPPEIRIGEISALGGVETIEQARSNFQRDRIS